MRDYDAFERRLSCAVAAGWWTVLIGMAWMSFGWLIWLLVAQTPSLATFVESVWGGASINVMKQWVWAFFALFKLMLFMIVLATVFLTIWRGKLSQADKKDHS